MFYDEDDNRYPRRIQKLFAPRLPFLYKKPIDYAPEQRKTRHISPVSHWKLEIEKYKADHPPPQQHQEQQPKSKFELYKESQNRQLAAWDDADAFENTDFLGDPHKTVFVARLYYTLSEVDLSKIFNRFGGIDSIRIIRGKLSGLSRGYGFIVFERDSDAKACIRELAPTGLAVDRPTPDTKPRKILVDMERGRLVRNWRPRRLGGGLGGRHYTQITALGSRDASAAATGRRMNLPQNPYQSHGQPRNYGKRPAPDRFSSAPPKRPAPSASYYSPSSSAALAESASSSRTPQSIRDKYAKYQNAGPAALSGGRERSIRSIRQSD